eukprot:5759492-Prymnesium_polylepis.1
MPSRRRTPRTARHAPPGWRALTPVRCPPPPAPPPAQQPSAEWPARAAGVQARRSTVRGGALQDRRARSLIFLKRVGSDQRRVARRLHVSRRG